MLFSFSCPFLLQIYSDCTGDSAGLSMTLSMQKLWLRSILTKTLYETLLFLVVFWEVKQLIQFLH